MKYYTPKKLNGIKNLSQAERIQVCLSIATAKQILREYAIKRGSLKLGKCRIQYDISHVYGKCFLRLKAVGFEGNVSQKVLYSAYCYNLPYCIYNKNIDEEMITIFKLQSTRK